MSKPTSYTLAIAVILCLGALLPVHAFALDLAQAKKAGLVGEQSNGLLGVVKQNDADVQALVTDINARRVSAYARIANKNDTTKNAVQMLAGKKAIQKTPSGQYIKPAASWIKVD